jgi:hypothetical protein
MTFESGVTIEAPARAVVAPARVPAVTQTREARAETGYYAETE